MQLRLTPTPHSEAEYATKTARARIDADRGSVAVLYRTNAQARAMQAAFKDEELPYRIAAGESFYESPHATPTCSSASRPRAGGARST